MTVVLATVVGGVLGIATKQRYESTAGLLMSVGAGNSAVELSQAATYLDRAMTSYVALATTPLVLDPVIEDLGLAESARTLALDIAVVNPTQTVLLDITVTRDDAKESALIANAVADELVRAVAETTPQPTIGRDPLLKGTVVATAVVPDKTSGLSPLATTAAGAAAGLLLALLLLVAVSVADRKVRRTAQLSGVGDGVLGHLTRVKSPTLDLTQLTDASPGSYGEELRLVREALVTSIPKRRGDRPIGPYVLFVTSPFVGDGKSTLSLGLADALAKDGSKVLLVDGNPRRPILGEALGLGQLGDLASAVAGTSKLSQVSQPVPGSSARIVGAKSPEVFESGGGAVMNVTSADEYDYVLIDGPELAGVSDGGSVAAMSSGVILVLGADTTTTDACADAINRLQRDCAGPVWTVLNKVRPSEVA